MIEVRYRVLDARLGVSIPLPAYATPGSAAMDLRAAPETRSRSSRAPPRWYPPGWRCTSAIRAGAR